MDYLVLFVAKTGSLIRERKSISVSVIIHICIAHNTCGFPFKQMLSCSCFMETVSRIMVLQLKRYTKLYTIFQRI